MLVFTSGTDAGSVMHRKQDARHAVPYFRTSEGTKILEFAIELEHPSLLRLVHLAYCRLDSDRGQQSQPRFDAL